MPRSISARVALTWSLLVLIVCIVGVVDSGLALSKLVRQDYDRAGQDLADFVALTAAEYLSNGKPEALVSLTENVQAGHLVVTDTEGRVIAGAPPEKLPLGREFRAAIASPEGRTLGYVRLWLGEPLEYPATAATGWALGAAPVLALGIYLAGKLARRTLQKPLTELAAACEQMSSGDFTTRPALKRSDELGALSRSLNAVCSHLVSLLAAVKAGAAELREGLDRLTVELEGAVRSGEHVASTLLKAREAFSAGVGALARCRERAEGLVSGLEAREAAVNRSRRLTADALRLMEEDAAAIGAILDRLEGCGSHLAEARQRQEDFLVRGRSWAAIVGELAALAEPLPSFVVEVALAAARTGREDLTRAAEDLNRNLREMQSALKALEGELSRMLEAGAVGERVLANGLEVLRELETYLGRARAPWQGLREALEEKQELESVGQKEERQFVQALRELAQEVERPLEDLGRFLEEELGETRLVTPDWEGVRAVIRKLTRSAERLYSLSVQYKT
ncbi:MAG: HAMP domain-containing protein [Moorellales bacterium]